MKEKIVFDNIIFDMQQVGGVSRYWSNLIQPFQKNAFFIESNNNNKNKYRSKLKLKNIIYEKNYLPLSITRYLNPNYSIGKEKHIFHSSFYRFSNNQYAINILTVHDMMYEKFIKSLKIIPTNIQKKKALKKADHIICISETTKKDLIDIYPFCKEKNISIIPHGIDSPIKIVSKDQIKKNIYNSTAQKYFLYVGNRGMMKGFDYIFKFLKEKEFLDINCLVIGSPFTNKELNLINQLNLKKRVINLGFVSDDELNYLYQNALFFLFPSIYEGFGFPLLEAMGNKCPVISSNIETSKDILIDSGIFFDLNNDLTISKTIKQIMNKKLVDSKIKSYSKILRKNDWKKIQDSYKEIYNKYV